MKDCLEILDRVPQYYRDMEDRLSSPSYSHLLYLNDAERVQYFSAASSSPKTRPESISFFSMTSSRSSSDSERSAFSEVSTPSTGPSSIQSAMIKVPKYADDHYPLITSLDPLSLVPLQAAAERHHAIACAKQMASIHNTIIRALNSSYNHAVTVQPATQMCRDFLKFNQILFDMIQQHHKIEDDFLFPEFDRLLNRSGAMHENIKGHESFKIGLERYREHIFDARTVEDYDAVGFRKTINGFAPDLIRHLHDEIPSILRMHTEDSGEVRKIWSRAYKKMTDGADMYLHGPFTLGCQDRTFLFDGKKLDFCGVPWFLETVVRKWHVKRYCGVWEFLPSDLYGNRRMLMA